MQHVLILICKPTEPALTDADAVAIQNAIIDAGYLADAPRTLQPGVAYDIAVSAAPVNALSAGSVSAPADGPDVLFANALTVTEIAGQILNDRPVDICLIEAANRRKKLLIADMDSTMIEQECIDELADYAGVREKVVGITERAMRGELDFEVALKERVRMLKGLSEETLGAAFRDRITFTPGGKTLIRTMSSLGAFTALVSGGFTFFTERVAGALGFSVHRANQLIVGDGRLTGDVLEPILGRAAKEASLTSFANAENISLSETLAVGDGANDLAMIKAAGLGVAFHAKPSVAEAASASISHGDLTALLFLQGISADEFVDE
ncbi:MAG: phosphoserine phosphatase SerB [Pseudomonadota bacterium]